MNLWKISSVKQFHEKRDRPTRVAVASLDHPDVSSPVVAEPKARGKAGLREPGPLSDRPEGGWAHSTIPGEFVVTIQPELALGVEFLRGRIFVAHALNSLVEIAQEAISHIVGFYDRVPAKLTAHLRDALSHFNILPCPVGKAPVVDERDIGTLFLYVNRDLKGETG